MLESYAPLLRTINRRISGHIRESNLRNITYQQATSTLRPFFFSVHPDFFGQQPEYRKQNEQSLKALNACLTSFGCSRSSSSSVGHKNSRLVFFVRKTALSVSSAATLRDYEPAVKPVQISLHHVNLRELVLHILQSANLPVTELLVQINKNTAINKNKSSASYNSSDDADKVARRPFEQTLSSWLLDNLPRAIELYFANQPIRANVFALEKALVNRYHFLEIVWHSDWTPSSHAACLRALQKILQQDRAKHVLPVLVGKRVIFGQHSGTSIFGDILLSVSDVPEAWLSAISEYHKEMAPGFVPRGYSLASLEAGVSMLLYRARVTRHPVVHKAMPVKLYYRQVRNLLQALLRYTRKEPSQIPKNLFSDMQICIEDVGGAPMYAEAFDVYVIPAGTPGFLVVDFLLKHHLKDEKSSNDFVKMNARYHALCGELKRKWGLTGISRDLNVSLQQGLQCLESISRYEHSVLPRVNALYGLEIRIARYFAVSGSGIIHIQWDAATV